MAVTVVEERTTINAANATTGWTGSATVSLFTTEPDPVEGTGCLGMVVSNATQDAYVTVSALNLTASPELIYFWIFHRAVLDTTANGGIGIQLGDGTNRVVFHLAGSDVDGFRHAEGPVGWQCLVLDPTNLPSAHTVRAGTRAGLNLSAITQIGVGFKTLAKAVGGATNCFWDISRRAAPGQGIRVAGGTSGDPGTWEQLAAEDRNVGANRAHGIVRRLGAGVFGVQGHLTFGDPTSDTYFEDINATVVFEDRNLSPDRGWYGVKMAGGSGFNRFRLGTKVGSEGSANGCTVAIPPGVGGALDAADSSFNEALLYGSRVAGFIDGVALSTDTNGLDHEVIGCTVDGCGRLLSGVVPLRATIINGTVEPNTVGAYLWDDDSDVARCSFTNNGRGIVFEAVPAGGTVTFAGLTFSGNGFDVRNDSGGEITISLALSGTPTVENIGGSTTIVEVSATHTLTNLQQNSRVTYVETNTSTELFQVASVGASGITEFVYTTPVTVDILIHHIEFVHILFVAVELTGVDATIPIFQAPDRVYSNPA